MSISPLRIADLGEGVEEGVVVAVKVSAGDKLAPEQVVLEIETDKVTIEVPAPRAGSVHRVCVAVDEVVHPGDVVIELQADDDTVPTEVTADAASATEAAETDTAMPARIDRTPPVASPNVAQEITADTTADMAVVPAGPGARREARELGVDIGAVDGSGVAGRISRDDVRRHVRASVAQVPAVAAPPDRGPALPDLGRYGPVRQVPATRIERSTARNLARAATVVPHAWVTRQIDLTQLEKARRALRSRREQEAAPLTLTAIACKAIAVLLLEMPRFNAAWDDAGEAFVYRDYVHVGIAVDTPAGLLVPVVRDADQKPIESIAGDIATLSKQARGGELEPAALGGAGITISNLGALGVDSLQPIVNWPEAAIVGMGRTVSSGVGEQSSIAISVTLGFDHRVINGADAARFLARLDELLEEPLALAVVA